MLRPRRNEWQMSFAEGGAAAIVELVRGTFDVLVCDMQMPDVDGITLLKYARDQHPQVARIFLSGQTRLETMTQVASIAHQFLSKPCNATDLVAVVERVCVLQSVLNNPQLQSIVGSIGDLPVLPRVYEELRAVLEDPDGSRSTVVRIVEQDVVLSARCLQFANSAFFGLPHRVDTLAQAVAYLGIAMLRDLVISSAAFSAFRMSGTLTHATLHRVEGHSIRVARLAQKLVENREASQQAFLAGMLHDLGYLILSSHVPELLRAHATPAAGFTTSGTTDQSLASLHPSVGAYLLGLWASRIQSSRLSPTTSLPNASSLSSSM
jgi:response regulator RpfG family c-di-GMP phosphodiesterase